MVVVLHLVSYVIPHRVITMVVIFNCNCYTGGYVITMLERFDFDLVMTLLICAITIIVICKCTWHATVMQTVLQL
jgi:hypothetical protein